MMKLIKTKRFTGIICCDTGLHIGGSSDEIEIGGVDMTIIKHPISKEPYIPGSSIKGKMRSSLERVKGFDEKGQPCGCGQCMICRIFGAHRNTKHNLGPTRIIVRDASMSEKSKAEMERNLKEAGLTFLEKKTENIINRATGAAKDPRSLERVPINTEFKLDIVLQIYDIDNETEMEKTVRDGLAWIERTYLGKGGSRGSGKVSFHELTVEEQPFTLE